MPDSGQPTFIHLRTHSAYSLLEGALKIGKLKDLALGDAQPALALTDTNNLFGALEFSSVIADAGIQPIIGSSLAVSLETAAEEGPGGEIEAPEPSGRIALLAKDETGYANLMRLSSTAYQTAADTGTVVVGIDQLSACTEGLIALTGGPEGPIDSAIAEGNLDTAEERLRLLHRLYGDRLYVEIQRHGTQKERAVEPELLKLAYGLELPIVATNESYFASQDDFEAHDALLCIAQGSYIAVDERRRVTPEHYFKTQSQMAALFADLPEAIANTVEIAKRCAYRPVKQAPMLPSFVADAASPEAQAEAEAQTLRERSKAGLAKRLEAQGLAPGHTEQDYAERLEFELDVIIRMKYPGYFLIVADFIQWAKAHGIPVGPGRGSGAGSLVAWVLTITDLDPIRFGLIFERFLNPDRVSMPDFDIDFCQDRRDEVIAYVRDHYGADRVAQIITFGKLQARAVLRDVGRVLQMPYGQVDKLCKLVPNNPANPVTLAEAIEGEPLLQEARDSEEIVAKLLDIGQRLEGLYRHASTHAAGVVIADRPLIDLVPLYRDPRAQLPATQFNMKWVENAGLVKFDFLGLKTLTVIQQAVNFIREKGEEIDMLHVPLDDKNTFEMLAHGETVGVFQVESLGMRRALVDMVPDRFEDLIALVALYRPGPMANIPVYCARKLGQESIQYLHPKLEPILAPTYGVITYQEQVQQIARDMAGFTLAEADLLRRAMGKKIKSEMDKQRGRFMKGAEERGIQKITAQEIFDACAKFAEYGFNKSHSAPYAFLTYQTAYLKANYPVEFLAASMTLDMGNTEKLAGFVQEAHRLGIEILPPSVNHSDVPFIPGEDTIRYSLAALRNVGKSAVEHIAAERQAKGPFKDISDFARRINPRHVNKRALEMLCAAGALDCLDIDRALAFENIDRILAIGNQSQQDANDGQNNLFGGDNSPPPPVPLRKVTPWLPTDRLAREFDAVGVFLTGHPLDDYQEILDAIGAESWSSLAAKAKSQKVVGKVAGSVVSKRERKSRAGNAFAFVGASDRTGQFEAVIFSEALNEARPMLETGNVVLFDLEAEMDGDTVKARILGVSSLEKAAARVPTGLRLVLDSHAAMKAIAETLAKNGNGNGRGPLRLLVRLDDMDREVELTLPQGISATPKQRGALSVIEGVRQIQSL
ncbi:DNA polymerase III subunit alpha [Methyloligella sp. 2.7D]|uniref:DNA polymerase III subunit alpha n=1 Tax=unclassified Methyloligella TaxID=2625955 RepID=UPI00157C6E6A|nr:DNA polymerase III subunit alpha [Methyloligella sp. GL2]QKP77528.1 DNA polymerase III subunit alpha [Methyloligella sp. GL2]